MHKSLFKKNASGNIFFVLPTADITTPKWVMTIQISHDKGAGHKAPGDKNVKENLLEKYIIHLK